MELLVERLHGAVAPAAALLSADERARAAQLRDAVARERFVLAHAFLRRALAQRLGVAPASLIFSRGPAGQPLLRGLHFSFSRSGALAALAVSARHPLGVDIERLRPLDVPLVAAHHFAPSEAQALAAATDPLAAFYRMWTRKEAALKAYGLGIAGVGAHSLARPPPARTVDFVPAPGFAGALARPV